ncbi:enamine deaminase RidA [Pseudoroseomonas deserti]|uniref:Enamine deaminase RidA n=1 Tax=Teichococcus deserti TaxID=1817963 RepID=A0A1V2H6M6_9PROT|nr:RidA family protein [Pseudoroseomonas deserti]ONG58031.1 enamine deaminase RidA [Pseudoroseomonas deserti]
MQIRAIAAADAPKALGGYAQAIEASGAQRLLFISGQVPAEPDGAVPPGFEAQARLAWRNVERQLAAAGMGLDNLLKCTTYLARREDGLAARKVRLEVLGDRQLALTTIVAGIFDEAWLLEIEAIAAA